MVVKNLEIQEVEDKKTQGGKAYCRFKTSEGWMSSFNSKTNKKLKELVGESVDVEVVQKGDFSNIKKLASPEAKNVKEEKAGTKENSKTEGKYGKKEMYVSYAKDCFCALCTRISQQMFDNMDYEERAELMDLAIEVVKKAEKAFK